MTQFDVLVFRSFGDIDWSKISFKKSMALLLFDSEPDLPALDSFVANLVGVGCDSFITWGPVADRMEDLVDYCLEVRGLLEVSTASFSDEDFDDVLSFIATAKVRSPDTCRCIMLIENMKATVEELSSRIYMYRSEL
jgi:hypothetical protein